jgi:hypothetical protein
VVHSNQVVLSTEPKYSGDKSCRLGFADLNLHLILAGFVCEDVKLVPEVNSRRWIDVDHGALGFFEICPALAAAKQFAGRHKDCGRTTFIARLVRNG